MQPFVILCLLAPGQAAVDFNRDVRPILADKCYHCHGPDEGNRKGSLRLDTAKGAARVLKGKHPEESELVARILTSDPDAKMPPADSNIAKSLTPREIDILKKWVAQGGTYARHWAYEPPVKKALPEPLHPNWTRPIDRFIAARLSQEKLSVSPRADKTLLIRRVTLDLTGLPPTPAEVQAFLQDSSPNAYEKVVDRLLASPRFGERMALPWMDLARYGDSSVFHADGPRDMWGWRDWVIRSFNTNKPFDQFTQEQIAGDLFPNATVDQKVASGFNRNHATTDEGGAIPEEYRIEYVIDRVKTVSTTWLAASMECGQCHDHKYDPITQKEYYQFFAFFNNTKDPGMQTRNGNQAPLVEIADPEAQSKIDLARKEREKAAAQFKNLLSDAGRDKKYQAWKKESAPAKPPAPTKETAAVKEPPLKTLFHLPLEEKDLSGLADLRGQVGFVVESKAANIKRQGGDGIKLPGNTLYQFDSDVQLDHDKPFTFSAWMKIPKDGGGFLLSRMDNDNAFRGFDLGLQGGKPGLHFIHHWSDNGLKVYAKEALTPDAWHHVVIRYDGKLKAAGVSILVDGKLQTNEVMNDNLKGTTRTEAPLRLGGRSDGGRFQGEIDQVSLFAGLVEPANIPATTAKLAENLKSHIGQPGFDAKDEETLVGYHARTQSKSFAGHLKSVAKALVEEKKLDRGVSSVMIMEDLPKEQMRTTFILNRGQYDQPRKDQPVTAATPAVLGGLPAGAPQNRLGLAQWMTRPDHPLTARVAVNRFWQLFMGEGLVRTAEDFGLQGEMPSHPELLDWLTVDFVESGWDVKRLIKAIVTSETYCQTPRLSSVLREKDPENRLFGRGPRYRLPGEFIRDQALFVSGLFVEKIGGPSVRPYQPANIWEDVALDTNLSRYVQDKGEKLYRRSMYTYWKRSSPHPSMTTFDAPGREKCTASRPRTNTPLQALVTLNDPQFVEAARAFGQRILKQAGSTPAERITFAYWNALGRPPRPDETAVMQAFVQKQKTRFGADRANAEKLLAIGEQPRDASLDPIEHAAWTMVASTLMNLDEFLMRN